MEKWEVKREQFEPQESELQFPFVILRGGEGQVSPLQGVPGRKEQVPG